MKKKWKKEEDMTSMKPYASDLSDARMGHPGTITSPSQSREAVLEVWICGRSSMGSFMCCAVAVPWRLLPHEYPAWSTVYDYFRKWRNAGIWEQIVTTLRERLRVQARAPGHPKCSDY